MTWHEPKTDWQEGEIVDDADMNEIGENLEYLYERPSDALVLTGTNPTTSSTSFVDIPNATITLTTTGGDVLVGFNGTFTEVSGATYVHVDLDINGTRLGNVAGGIAVGYVSSPVLMPISFTVLLTNLAAGTHTFKVQWSVNGGTGLMYTDTVRATMFAKEI